MSEHCLPILYCRVGKNLSILNVKLDGRFLDLGSYPNTNTVIVAVIPILSRLKRETIG